MQLSISILALTVSVIAVTITAYVNIWRTRQANRVRYWMFAHEAVELHRRWVLYAGQVLESLMLSQSRPFEWIAFGTVEEFLRVGGEQSVVDAVYRVKQLQFQVILQLIRAQKTGDEQRRIVDALPPVEVRTDEHREAERLAIKTFHDDLGFVVAFILSPDEWHPVCAAIQHLLDSAREHGNEVADLEQRFNAQKQEGDQRYAEWSARRGH